MAYKPPPFEEIRKRISSSKTNQAEFHLIIDKFGIEFQYPLDFFVHKCFMRSHLDRLIESKSVYTLQQLSSLTLLNQSDCVKLIKNDLPSSHALSALALNRVTPDDTLIDIINMCKNVTNQGTSFANYDLRWRAPVEFMASRAGLSKSVGDKLLNLSDDRVNLTLSENANLDDYMYEKILKIDNWECDNILAQNDNITKLIVDKIINKYYMPAINFGCDIIENLIFYHFTKINPIIIELLTNSASRIIRSAIAVKNNLIL